MYYEVDSITVPTLQRRELRHSEVKKFVQSPKLGELKDKLFKLLEF